MSVFGFGDSGYITKISKTAATQSVESGSRIRQWVGKATVRQLLTAQNPKHQAPLQQTRVRQIARNFNPTMIDVFKVRIDENGVWWLEDGQHRRGAAELAGYLDLMVPVLFTDGMDEQEAAEYFLGINDRKKKPIGALIQARAEAGDPVASAMFAVAGSHGFTVKLAEGGYGYKKNEISSAAKLYEIVKSHGADHASQVISVLREAWDGEGGSAHHDILLGISQFLIAYPEVPVKELARKLGDELPKTILGEIAAARVAEKTSRQIRSGFATGRGVLAVFNKNKKQRRLDDRFNDAGRSQ